MVRIVMGCTNECLFTTLIVITCEPIEPRQILLPLWASKRIVACETILTSHNQRARRRSSLNLCTFLISRVGVIGYEPGTAWSAFSFQPRSSPGLELKRR